LQHKVKDCHAEFVFNNF